MNSAQKSTCHFSSSSSSKKSMASMVVKCHHDMAAKLQICRKRPNVGKKLYSCPLWKTSGCKFFAWEDDAQVEEGRNIMQIIDELKQVFDIGNEELIRLQTKVERLKNKKKRLEDEMNKVEDELMEAKLEASLATNREKLAIRVVLLTWFSFVFVGLIVLIAI